MAHDETTVDYYLRRAAMERAAATAARDTTVRDIHLTIAEHYTRRSAGDGDAAKVATLP